MTKEHLLINYIWGKLIFSLLGYAVFDNWLGIVVGFIIGFIVDIFLAKTQIHIFIFKNLFGIFRSKNKIYRQTLFMSLGYLAKADGVVSPQEIAVAESIFSKMKLNAKARQQAIEYFQAGKFADQEINLLLKKLTNKFKRDENLRKNFLDTALQICFADNPPTSEQIIKIKTLLPKLNITNLDFDRSYERILLKQPLDKETQKAEYAKFKQTLQTNKSQNFKVKQGQNGVNQKETKEDFKTIWQNAWDLHKKQQADNKAKRAKEEKIRNSQKAEAKKQRQKFEQEFREKTRAREEAKRQEQSEQKFNDNFGFNQGYTKQGKYNNKTTNYKDYHRLMQAYETLGVDANASSSEIKTTYRKLISKYHPDKLASQRLSPAMRIAAKNKMQEIQEAFENIKRIKGI